MDIRENGIRDIGVRENRCFGKKSNSVNWRSGYWTSGKVTFGKLAFGHLSANEIIYKFHKCFLSLTPDCLCIPIGFDCAKKIIPVIPDIQTSQISIHQFSLYLISLINSL